MQALELRAFFRLPDDFKGTESDAIRLLAAYHEGPGKENPERKVLPADRDERTRDEQWDEFYSACRTGMFSLIGAIQLFHVAPPSTEGE
jgi:hypothetical protein